ncbi:hypothetical protein BX266_0178 [Streptomyces sp. TLI_171]|nr:hypothetical protein BX266_0178 [Streptomyces sp. TLI_171]
MHDEITATVGSDFSSFDGRVLEIFGASTPAASTCGTCS